MIRNNQKKDGGFSLIEILLVIIIMGILTSVAMQSLTSSIDETRRVLTEREMEILAKAIVGDPSIMQNGQRSDFGYIGDNGAFPPNLQALVQNPGLGTWNGPYIEYGFSQDSTGFKTDEWGQLYAYTGGISIASSGSGSTISKKIADNSNDYLLNSFTGLIRDSENNPPGSVYDDSIDVVITIPNGSGGTVNKACHPDRFGMFTLDSVPSGAHPLRIIYTPNVDTLLAYLTVLPRHKGEKKYKFSANYFADTSGTGGGAPLAISIRQTRTLGGLSFNDEDIIIYDRGADTSSMLFDGSTIFTGNEDVDAVHILANNNILLSTTTQAEIGGVSFNEDDVVIYNPSTNTAAILLYGDSLFSSPENITAVHLLDSAHILLSTDNTASIGTLSFQSRDIVEYDLDTDSAWLYFNGSSAFNGAANVNAVHVLSNGHIILSVNGVGRTIGSLTFGREDLVEYDPVSGTATMYFDGDAYFTSFPTNINAVHVGSGSGNLSGGGSSTSYTLRPDSSGTITNLTDDGCASNYQCVDESSSDGDATRVKRSSNSYATDVYSIENPVDTSGSVINVTVWCRARKQHVQGQVRPTIYVNSTEYNGTEQNLTTSYADYSRQWTTNPNTGLAWTWTEIINLQAGVRIKGQGSNFPGYCTQIWVEVSYGP